jgi:polyphosphate kinase
MLQRWTDHEGVEHRVLEDYNRNKILCDLTQQPDEIKKIIVDTIQAEINKEKNISQVGIRLMKFCAQYDLIKVSEQAQSYSDPLNARYHQ